MTNDTADGGVVDGIEFIQKTLGGGPFRLRDSSLRCEGPSL